MPPAIRFNISLFAAAVIAAVPAIAGNQSRVESYTYGDGLVEVVADFSEDAIYWCGAAEYARNSADVPGNSNIYVWQGPSASTARPGEKSVKFGFAPPPSGEIDSLTGDVETVGNFMSINQARQTCNERTASG